MTYIQFLGAAGTVTGSKHLINTGGFQVLVDCGLFQGPKEWRERNWQALPIPAQEIDAVILTHAHLDHCGWIPRLVKSGFKGPIYATPPTIDLCGVILPDSGHLQEEDAAFANKHKTSRHDPALPLYTMQEAEDCLQYFKPLEVGAVQRLNPDFTFSFVRAAHIVGSAMAEVTVRAGNGQRRLLFTGDIGRVRDSEIAPGKVVHSGPQEGESADLLVMESTYGNRLHPTTDPRPELAKLVADTVKRGGSVVVPAFAVERTEKFLFLLKDMMESGEIPRVPVHTDSPMAIKAVEIFLKYKDEFSEQTKRLIDRFGSPLTWQNFFFDQKVEDSKKINASQYPMIIVSSSGMAAGGRVLHHLAQRLPDPKNTVIFIGFQAPGTRGAFIKAGARTVKIFGQEIPARAHVAAIEQFSDHADTPELLEWLRTFKKAPAVTYLVHGEPAASSQLRLAMTSALRWKVEIAQWLQKVEVR
ncbi:MAG: MBL fold metallo-hydrolase [Candidatus Koribacter versatilis]|uniref:MBL fold metallo-hydrolase n=1 Tax=Candidatus Korobacter versatilis TaxID=658062 RepID=A0A932A9G0_9BACT|nr:MBL fold metallo-hydrolase [Candidatus Koribacter versatilis]